MAEARRRAGPAVSEGELAARILEGWRAGKTPLKLIVALRVHPRSVREVIEAYAELLTTWKQYSVATTSSDTAPASTLARFLPAIEDAEQFGRDLDRRPSKSGADRDATR